MLATLTSTERQIAFAIAALVSFAGLALAAAGRGDPLEFHGFLILFFGLVCLALVANVFLEPEPSSKRLSSYYDEPIKAGIVVSMAWAVFAMGIGVWVAAQLAWPNL